MLHKLINSRSLVNSVEEMENFVVLKFAIPEKWQVDVIRERLEGIEPYKVFITNIAKDYFGHKMRFDCYEDAYEWAKRTELLKNQAIIVFKDTYLNHSVGPGSPRIMDREILFQLHNEMREYLKYSGENQIDLLKSDHSQKKKLIKAVS